MRHAYSRLASVAAVAAMVDAVGLFEGFAPRIVPLDRKAHIDKPVETREMRRRRRQMERNAVRQAKRASL